MKYTICATNTKTLEIYELGAFPTSEEAWWNVHNNIEWDEDDNPDDYTFQVVETNGAEDNYNEDLGFDPYMGQYTDEC